MGYMLIATDSVICASQGVIGLLNQTNEDVSNYSLVQLLASSLVQFVMLFLFSTTKFVGSFVCW